MNYLSKLELSLQANKITFVNECRDFFSKLINTPYKIILYSKHAVYNPLRLDSNHSEILFSEFVNSLKNPQFKNENLSFKIPSIHQTPWEMQEETNDQYYNILNSCMDEFWINADHQKEFGRIANFDLFEELIIDEVSFKKIQKLRRGALIEVGSWLTYCRTLIEIIFDDFILTKSRGKEFFFKKKIKENVYLCFEYDEISFKREVNYGKLLTPELKLFLLICDESDTCQHINFGLLENPFFCLDWKLQGYYATKKVTKNSNGIYHVKNDYETEKIQDGKIRVYGDQTLGEDLKKYAYYYFNAQKTALVPYFNYIISSLNLVEN